jgi:hypothetical protein
MKWLAPALVSKMRQSKISIIRGGMRVHVQSAPMVFAESQS